MTTKDSFRTKLKVATETGRARILKFEEEAQKLMHKVAEKGRDAQAVGKRRLDELMDRAPLLEKVREADVVKRVQTIRGEVEERLEGGMDRLLDALGIASKGDVQALTKRIESLARKIGELAKLQQAKLSPKSKGAAKPSRTTAKKKPATRRSS